MAISNSLPDFKPEIIGEFTKKAQRLMPSLIRKTIKPVAEARIVKGDEDWESVPCGAVSDTENREMGKGDSFCLDFGDHSVGYVSFKVTPVGSPPDAPAFLRIKLGEHPCEIGERSEDYSGELSSGWIQEEYLHIDILPAVIRLPRRYAFRYMQILVKDTSPCYRIKIHNIECETVTSADISLVSEPDTKDAELRELDRISVKTMSECMQEVFEDGPKRDRRLWIGDLRLQALVNYKTFKNYDLVKRCLYLFAGLNQNEGRVAACLYLKPEPYPADVALFDYSLFFISCLYDYYKETNDKELLLELYPTAQRQIELAAQRFDENGVVRDSDDWWCFLDWHEKLNKQAGAQAVFIYTLKQARELAAELKADTAYIDSLLSKAIDGAIERLWDEKLGFFTSGKDRQVSWVSQIWFVIAGIFDKGKNSAILRRLIDVNPDIGIVTPYMAHHFVQALIDSEMKSEAEAYMRRYWGGMASDGADCFYELYDPENKTASPYGSRVINSYCHAWSGTPAYFIRKYWKEKVYE